MEHFKCMIKIDVTNLLIELAEGVPKKGVDDIEVMAQIKAAWHAMSEEEQIACTEEKLAQIEEERKTKSVGKHTVALNAFHDMNSTVTKVEDMVSTYRNL